MEAPVASPSYRVLVVAYYFPPMGLSGVQRITKFVKYLPEYGWQPTVLTVEPGGYFAFDESLLAEVEAAGVEIVRTKTFDPTRLFGKKKTVPMPGGTAGRWVSRINRTFFIPDNKIGWKKHAMRTGRKLLAERSFDLILSTSPPETAHLIGLQLSKESGLPYVADFREEWVDNSRQPHPTALHRARHMRLENAVVRHADAVTTINRPIKEAIVQRHLTPQEYGDVHVISHGYDPADFDDVNVPPRDIHKLRFVYSGIFYGPRRPDTFLRGLARLLEDRPELKTKVEALFVGLLSDEALRLVEKLALQDVVATTGYVSHEAAVAELMAADVLWTTIGRRPGVERFSTGKVYEYMASRKPILGLVPEGAERDTLEKYGAHFLADPDSVDETAAALAEIAARWEMGSLPQPDEGFVQAHDRRQLTGDLARLMNNLIVIE